MYSLLWTKRVKAESARETSGLPPMEWLVPMMPIADGHAHPEWSNIFDYTDENINIGEADYHVFWSQVARNWMSALSASLTKDYLISETDNFILLSASDSRYREVRWQLVF